MEKLVSNKSLIIFAVSNGGIAQLARAFDWQSKGQGFDSPYLHLKIRGLQKSVNPFCL